MLTHLKQKVHEVADTTRTLKEINPHHTELDSVALELWIDVVRHCAECRRAVEASERRSERKEKRMMESPTHPYPAPTLNDLKEWLADKADDEVMFILGHEYPLPSTLKQFVQQVDAMYGVYGKGMPVYASACRDIIEYIEDEADAVV